MNDSRAAAPIGAADAESAKLMRRATTASVAVALILIVAKLVAFLITDSVAILSTLVDSLLDVLASLLNLVAVRHALQPADREHRFGHGKAEALAGLGQAGFIAGSAAFLLFEAGRRLISPQPLAAETVGIGVMVVSIVLTVALVRYQRYVIGRTRSVAISADSLHYKGDVLVNASVIVSLAAGAALGWTWLDPAFAIAIAGYIAYCAWQILREVLNVLMDRELPDIERTQIRKIAMAHPEVRAIHDLRTRRSGMMTFIQFHLELDGAIKLTRAHEISDQVEADVMAAFPGAEVIIHQDPAGIEEGHVRFA
jgi:ferrous-iron efflux pump FieF